MPRRNRTKSRRQFRRVANPSMVPRSARQKYELSDHLIVPVGRCGRKLSFGTKQDALDALAKIVKTRARQNASRAESRCYLHDRCGRYHLTGQTEWEERK